jgi:hypothetical protein
MGLNNITFIRQAGSGKRASGNDNISGMIFYSSTLPAGFSSNDRVKKIYSIEQAEDLGIVDTHADETKATGGNVLITTVGAVGTTWNVKIDEVSLGTYVVLTDDDATDVAVGLRAAINLLTKKHGFVASGSTGNVALAAPAKMGITLNTAVISATNSGAGASTLTQFSAGAGSQYAVWHYHIKEFFRMKPDGILYVGIYAVPSPFTAAEVETMQNTVSGLIRQFAIYLPGTTFASSQVDSVDLILGTLRDEHNNAIGLFHADMATLTLSTLSDMSSLDDPKVAVVLGEDGNFHQTAYSATASYINGDKVRWLNKTYIAVTSSTGQAPYDTSYFSEVCICLALTYGKSVSTLGNLLGVIAAAAVHQSVAYVEKFNLVDGLNMDEAGFATKVLYKNQTKATLDGLQDKHYIFLRKYNGFSGTYYNDSYTAVSQDSATNGDYATIENNRVMDKAERNIYMALVPKLSSPLYVDTDGKLSQATIDMFTAIVDSELEFMQVDGEISDREVSIDPDQNVTLNSKLIVGYNIRPVGVARNIQVYNAFKLSI